MVDALIRHSKNKARGIGKVMLLAAFAVISLKPSTASAATYEAFSNSKNFFKLSGDIAPRVYFWENIFIKYDSDTYVVHDIDEPWIVIDIIPFEKLAKKRSDNSLLERDTQRKLAQKYINRYNLALERFAKEGKKALDYGSMERRIHTVYKQSLSALKKLYSGTASIRYQQGLSDTFIDAAKRAQNYLPYVEKEFRSEGVPIEITRLAFVESMFNSHAISKVGASGMWQFMKSTAKQYMKVNSKIDERNSPIKAARAAAKLLKENYKSLKSWPLAITAYNHGRAGMKRAVSAVKSKNLATIIKSYEKKSFGFASQNFYSEFMAALRSYNYLIKKNIINVRPSELDIVSVKLKKPVKIKNLTKHLKIPKEDLLSLNKCIKKKTVKNHPYYKLPKNYELYIPRKYSNKINYNIARLSTKHSRG